ncbi:uncharacterized protein LOC108221396 [Daucus carota subsp. sativus]|uniref:uncharacterized protein LOC108221396 n=1 Tax=Daucus carota subsp. sativus TaxID=79200 RepID=UPI003082CB2E
MYIRLVVGAVIGMVICVYAPQVGLGDIESMTFWGCLDDLVRSIPQVQFLFVGGDFNGHIGARVDGYQGSKVTEFKDMLEGCFGLVDDVDQMWTNMANSIKSAAKRVLGVSLGKDITARWGRYFSELFNVARGREIVFENEIVHVPNNDVHMGQDIDVAEVRAALCMMGKGKEVGLDEIPIEVWQCLAEQGVRWLTAFFNVIFRTSRMPSEWRLSVVEPIYKNKGDAQSCSNYLGIKLLSHTMKLWERVIECRVRRIVTISANQFGFMPGRSTIEVIYLIRCLMEKYRERCKDLHVVFIDLEKAYDSIPRAVLWRCLVARGVPSMYIRTIQDTVCISSGDLC